MPLSLAIGKWHNVASGRMTKVQQWSRGTEVALSTWIWKANLKQTWLTQSIDGEYEQDGRKPDKTSARTDMVCVSGCKLEFAIDNTALSRGWSQPYSQHDCLCHILHFGFY